MLELSHPSLRDPRETGAQTLQASYDDRLGANKRSIQVWIAKSEMRKVTGPG